MNNDVRLYSYCVASTTTAAAEIIFGADSDKFYFEVEYMTESYHQFTFDEEPEIFFKGVKIKRYNFVPLYENLYDSDSVDNKNNKEIFAIVLYGNNDNLKITLRSGKEKIEPLIYFYSDRKERDATFEKIQSYSDSIILN